MPGDPHECRERAKRCWALAAEVKNPALKESLVNLAQRWSALPTDLEARKHLLEAWGEPGFAKSSIGPDQKGRTGTG
jgi:hypothetical protein